MSFSLEQKILENLSFLLLKKMKESITKVMELLSRGKQLSNRVTYEGKRAMGAFLL